MFHILRANESHGVSFTSDLVCSCAVIAKFLKDVDPDGPPSSDDCARVEAEARAWRGRHPPADNPEEGVKAPAHEAVASARQERERLFQRWCAWKGIDPLTYGQ